MKIKALIGATALMFGAVGAAHADNASIHIGPKEIISPTFTDVLVGNFSISQSASDVTGVVYPLNTISGPSPFGGTLTFTLAQITVNGAHILGHVDLNPAADRFAYSNLGLGNYAVYASGTWTVTAPQVALGAIVSDVTLTNAVPEPAPVALAGLGLATLWLRRRQSAASKQA